eukprot:PhF_6_TR15099/c0_g4_i1/m.23765
MSQIPSDIWFEILQFSTVRDAVRVGSLINKQTWKVLTDDSFWRVTLLHDSSDPAHLHRLKNIVSLYNGPRSFLALYKQRYLGKTNKIQYTPDYAVKLEFACPLVWEELSA